MLYKSQIVVSVLERRRLSIEKSFDSAVYVSVIDEQVELDLSSESAQC